MAQVQGDEKQNTGLHGPWPDLAFIYLTFMPPFLLEAGNRHSIKMH